MNDLSQFRHLRFLLGNFEQFTCDAVVCWLEEHKDELQQACHDQGDIGIAAEDLTKLISNRTLGASGDLVRIKRNLTILLGSANQPTRAGTPPIQPQSNNTRWLQIAQLVVTIIGVMVGTSYGVVGRLWPDKSAPAQNPSVPLPLTPGPKQAIVLHILQMAVILCFVFIQRSWLKKPASRLTDAVPIAKKTLEQFTAGWLFMWYAWLALYTWFSVAAIIASLKGTSPAIESLSDVLDTVSGFSIWWCFLVLDMPSVNTAGQPKRDRTFWEAVYLTVAVGVICATLSVLDRTLHWGYFGVATVGLYNGLAIASLTGRFGSHYIGTPRWMLLCLYFYSMLQLFYSFLPVLNAELWTPAIYLLALLMKMVLAWAATHMVLNGGLLQYLGAAQSGALGSGGWPPYAVEPK